MAGPEIKKPAGGGTATTGDDWQTFALEYDEDRKSPRL